MEKIPPGRLTPFPSFGVVLVAVALVWWLAIRMLWNEWEIDPQYSYGFLVPLLCAGLFLKRWEDQPVRRDPTSKLAWGVAALPCLFFLLAVQPFYEANPEWRVPGFLGAISAVVLTLILLQALGGPVWARHFLFPVSFFLIAIPWPRNTEEALMGFLMEKNAMATLEALHWLGYESMRRGNLISLPTGTIGIEEACSGVRSLQSGIMASLFLGEMFRLKSVVRVVLVAVSILVALAGNFIRATLLSIVASTEGMAAVEKWHDLAGHTILASTLGAVFLFAYGYQFFCKKGRHPDAWIKKNSQIQKSHSIPLSVAWACAIAALLSLASLTGTELWYRSHESPASSVKMWSMKPGTDGTKPVSISDRTRRILFHPEGFSERFIDSHGRNWQYFYLRWPAGRTAIQALNIHDPRTCLASIGMKLEKQLPSVTLHPGGQSFRFRVFLFRDAGRPVLVFHSIVADGVSESHSVSGEDDMGSGEYTLKGRWEIVKKGIRNRGQTALEAAVWGTSDVSSAANSLTSFMTLALEKAQEG
ncbi:MAG: exosortase/archaeosortase family protein [bacterium]